MSHSPDTQDFVGLISGAVIGMFNFVFTHTHSPLSIINFSIVFETALLSAIGATVGFLITQFLKWCKKKLSK
jgi:hypothetical protein